MSVPAYDDLPQAEGLDLPCSWRVFGCGDQFGTLNYLTSEVTAAAFAEARDGIVIPLNLPVSEPFPPLFGREETRHEYFQHDRNTWDDRLDAYFPQGSTQWDGFRHVRARELGFYGGVTDDPDTDPSWLGIDHWARRGIAGRGVLLDVGRHLGGELRCDEDRALTAEFIAKVAAAQSADIRHGDVLVLRTGWPRLYSALPAERHTELREKPAFPGLHAGEETARLLWNWHVSAVVTDLPAVEVVPGDPKSGSLHRRLLPLLGLPLGELFDLERLAEHCHESGRSSFLFTSAPLHLVGGCGSPANALALF
jgi:kynurenine formamidase